MTGHNGNGTIIEIHDVVKSFPMGETEVTILKEVSFEVRKGKFLSIVGPSGSGKSTLLNMVAGIDHPSAGEVTISYNGVNR